MTIAEIGGQGDIEEQEHVHHQGIDNGRDGDDLVGKDEGAASDGDGLGGVLHADFDDDGAAFGSREAEKEGKKCAATHGEEDEGWEGDASEDVVDAQGDGGFGSTEPETTKDGDGHEHEVLHQEVTDWELHIGTGAYAGGGPCHDEGHGEEGDEGTAGSEGDGEGYVATGKHGEDVAGAATWAAGDEHDAYQE